MIYQSGPSALGDCWWTLVMLKRIGGPHIFHVPMRFHAALQDCLEGTEIQFADHKSASKDALCTWIGSQRFENKGISWGPHVGDIIKFLQRWGNFMCEENGVEHKFNDRRSMLADFPAIQRYADTNQFPPDCLVVNARPGSNQCPRLNFNEFDELIDELSAKHVVVTTNTTDGTPLGYSLCEIGAMSLNAKLTVAVATGAHWGIHNVWQPEQPPIYLFLDDPLHIRYSKVRIPNHGLVNGMRQQLQKEGWL